jgi:hypothetical protein
MGQSRWNDQSRPDRSGNISARSRLYRGGHWPPDPLSHHQLSEQPYRGYLSESGLKNLGELLRRKEKELGRSIILISDEPYARIRYEDTPMLRNLAKEVL